MQLAERCEDLRGDAPRNRLGQWTKSLQPVKQITPTEVRRNEGNILTTGWPDYAQQGQHVRTVGSRDLGHQAGMPLGTRPPRRIVSAQHAQLHTCRAVQGNRRESFLHMGWKGRVKELACLDEDDD